MDAPPTEPHDDGPTDAVDRILAQWARERPDLDASPMGIIGRISRLERLVRPRLNACFAEHGLESWEFDVLATLRRSGPPFRLRVGALVDQMMITSGSMTNRIDRLEARGLVTRLPDEEDGRVVLVALTDAGRTLIDTAVEAHVANEHAILAELSPDERAHLADTLRAAARALAPPEVDA